MTQKSKSLIGGISILGLAGLICKVVGVLYRIPLAAYIGGEGIGSGEPTGAVQQPPVDGQTHPVIEGQKVFGRFHG